MGKALIVVESPAKIKTLKKFLGKGYVFASSIGHIRDLPKKGFGIDIDNNFTPNYEVLPDKKQVVKELVDLAKQCDEVYLAPDPDREGEAIAWHIAALLPEDCKVQRATFYSITEQEVQKALSNPREIDLNLVNAQQARRLLDRIVGYKISPILVRRVQGNGSVSAGRVQSVALKIVVNREKDIRAFRPVEYWTIKAKISPSNKKGDTFEAILHSIDGKKIEKELIEGKEVALISDEATAGKIASEIEKNTFAIDAIQKREKKRNPVPPFITSTLQQEASRHFGFSSARTMRIAQSLYEGVTNEQGDVTEGLITYMRTDSVRLAPEAIQEARSYIEAKYGKEYIPSKAKTYSAKKTAQDAHEAIRPTEAMRTPESLKGSLPNDLWKLYSLIWKRHLACQMESAVYDTVSIDITSGSKYMLRATGSTLKFPGFLALYEEKTDEDIKDKNSRLLPELHSDTPISCHEISKDQSFTKPPARFSEASLVKELEKLGIGRPSTYASIMSKIQDRSYSVKEKGRLHPTELGEVICALLEVSFPQIMDIDFTANLENDLECVAEDQKNWKGLLQEFWKDFEPYIEKAEKEAFVPKVDTDLSCPKCDKPLVKIWSRSKYFYGCSNYPDCDYTSTIEAFTFDKSEYSETFDWEQNCPICEGPMKTRHGRFGTFLGCLKYPECKGTVTVPKKGEELPSAQDLPNCPAIDCPGKITMRKSRFGKIFYSCSTYPECNVIANSIELLEDKYHNHPRTPYEKKKKAAKGKGAKKTKKATPKKKSASTTRRGPTYIPSEALEKSYWKRSLYKGRSYKTALGIYQRAQVAG